MLMMYENDHIFQKKFLRRDYDRIAVLKCHQMNNVNDYSMYREYRYIYI
jgi:hypothetical protein